MKFACCNDWSIKVFPRILAVVFHWSLSNISDDVSKYSDHFSWEDPWNEKEDASVVGWKRFLRNEENDPKRCPRFRDSAASGVPSNNGNRCHFGFFKCWGVCVTVSVGRKSLSPRLHFLQWRRAADRLLKRRLVSPKRYRLLCPFGSDKRQFLHLAVWKMKQVSISAAADLPGGQRHVSCSETRCPYGPALSGLISTDIFQYRSF